MTVDTSEHAQRLTTTLNLLKKAGACTERYRHLVKGLGGTKFDHNQPINLLTILELNGTEDCLWSLRATAENCDRVARLMACDFAEATLKNFERDYPDDKRPREAIAVARRFALGLATEEERLAAESAAVSAARSAAESAQAEIIKKYLLPD